jgi:hypothetical protein
MWGEQLEVDRTVMDSLGDRFTIVALPTDDNFWNPKVGSDVCVRNWIGQLELRNSLQLRRCHP